MTTSQYRSRGFSLVELMVVVAIIAILVGLLLPAIQAAREAARRTGCSSNLRQVGIALHTYHDSLNAFPSGWISSNSFAWGALLLPYIEQGPLHDRLDFRRPLADPATSNPALARTTVMLYRCPSDSGPFNETPGSKPCQPSFSPLTDQATGSYVGNFGDKQIVPWVWVGNGGFMSRNSNVRMASIIDGLSNSVAIGERIDTCEQPYWAGLTADHDRWDHLVLGSAFVPLNEITDPAQYSSRHPNGAYFLLCDGSVRFVKETVDTATYKSLMLIADGELLGDF